MTMKEKLTVVIDSIRSNDKILSLDEGDIRTRFIDPILDRLGWEPFDKHQIEREFSVQGGKVDYALLVNRSPRVFIEAKRPSTDLKSNQDQLFAYCAKREVQLAVLTNGIEWSFYLRPQDGKAEDQQFCKLSIYKGMSKSLVPYTSDCLIGFLSRERICSGEAVSNAEDVLVRSRNINKVNDALPRAWEELKNGPDDQLVKLIGDKVLDLCGLRPETDQITEFLAGLGKGGAARKPADPSYPRRLASSETWGKEAVRAEFIASFRPIVFTMSPNSRCPDCDDVIELSKNDSTSTCKSCRKYPDAASAGRISGRRPAQGTHGPRGTATVTEFDIKGKMMVILGKPGSGKTVMARHFAGLFDPTRLAVWDPMNEFGGGPGVHVPPEAQDKTEFSQWLASTLPPDGKRSSYFDAVIINEANLCFPRSTAEMKRYPEIEKFVNLNRHFGITFIAIGKRPAHLSSDVLEMASDIMVFKLSPLNDARKLNDFADGMGRDAAALPDFHFLLYKDKDGDYNRCRPIKMSEMER